MTSRERVLAALNHRVPDRVPIDFGSHGSSGIAATAYPRLRAELGLPPRTTRVYDPVQQLAAIDPDVFDCLGVDTTQVGYGVAFDDDRDWADCTLPDGTPCKMPAWAAPERTSQGWVLRSASGRVLARMPEGSAFFDQTYWPFYEQDDLDHIPEAMRECIWTAKPSFPGPLDPARLAETARRLREKTDRAVVAVFGGNLLEMGQYLYRMDRFMMLLGEAPARVHAFLDKVTELHLARLERFLGAVGPYVDVVNFGDDLGGQSAPLLSPRMYREFLKPRQEILWKSAKKLAPHIKVMLHSCGAIRPLLPDLIEAGLDAINPVQVACKGMEAEGLKRDFGRDLVFWGGGCDTQRILPMATPDEVAAHVRGQIQAFAPGGGFVFQQVHNIQANVPAANIVAMFRAAAGSDVYVQKG
jgi:uroporphyrinogen decarboxylase